MTKVPSTLDPREIALKLVSLVAPVGEIASVSSWWTDDKDRLYGMIEHLRGIAHFSADARLAIIREREGTEGRRDPASVMVDETVARECMDRLAEWYYQTCRPLSRPDERPPVTTGIILDMLQRAHWDEAIQDDWSIMERATSVEITPNAVYITFRTGPLSSMATAFYLNDGTVTNWNQFFDSTHVLSPRTGRHERI